MKVLTLTSNWTLKVLEGMFVSGNKDIKKTIGQTSDYSNLIQGIKPSFYRSYKIEISNNGSGLQEYPVVFVYGHEAGALLIDDKLDGIFRKFVSTPNK